MWIWMQGGKFKILIKCKGGLCCVLRSDIIYSSYCWNYHYNSIYDIICYMYIEEMWRMYRKYRTEISHRAHQGLTWKHVGLKMTFWYFIFFYISLGEKFFKALPDLEDEVLTIIRCRYCLDNTSIIFHSMGRLNLTNDFIYVPASLANHITQSFQWVVLWNTYPYTIYNRYYTFPISPCSFAKKILLVPHIPLFIC